MSPSTPSSSAHAPQAAQGVFATTHWSLVLTAGRQDTTRASMALEKLCQTYWYPLYAYLRRRGYSAHDAQDLTQGFFQCLLVRQSLANVDPARGRFRSFMLGALNHFLADHWAKSGAQKRGGHGQHISLDLGEAEERFGSEPADPSTPDSLFDRAWATALLQEVLDRLEDEYAAQGKSKLFAVLKIALAGEGKTNSCSRLGAQVGLSEGAVRVAVHRMRKRYRELLRAEVANTVSSPEEIKEELRYLCQIMSNS